MASVVTPQSNPAKARQPHKTLSCRTFIGIRTQILSDWKVNSHHAGNSPPEIQTKIKLRYTLPRVAESVDPTPTGKPC